MENKGNNCVAMTTEAKDGTNMSKNYNSFVFYGSIRDTIEHLPRSQGNELLNVTMCYGTTGEIIPCSKVVMAVFLSIKPNIDSAQKKYKKRGETMLKKEQETETKQEEDEPL